MFDRIRIARLEAKLAKTQRHFQRRYAEWERKATAQEKDEGDDGGLQLEWHFETGILEEQIDQLFSRSLVNKARRLRVPIPPSAANRDGNEWWAFQEYTHTWCLTQEGILRRRTAIRAERKERRDAFLAWMPVAGAVTALTGLIGTATALVLALTRK